MYVLIYVFRISHDRMLLQEISRVFELARSKLVDSCNPSHPEIAAFRCRLVEDRNGQDGYLNWVYLRDLSSLDRSDNVAYVGTDYHLMEEMLIHGMVANVAWILRINSGDSAFGEEWESQANFWFDYLLNHFEAKWEMRAQARPDIALSFSNLPHKPLLHPTMRLTTYYWYMSKLLGERYPRRATQYRAESIRRVEQTWNDDMRMNGFRLVWAHQRGLETLQMTIYANITAGNLGEMAMDGHPALVDREVLEGLGGLFRDDLYLHSRRGEDPYRVAIGQNRADSEWHPCQSRVGSGRQCVEVDGRVFRRYEDERKARPSLARSIFPLFMGFGIAATELRNRPVFGRVARSADSVEAYGARGALAFEAHLRHLSSD